MSRSDSGRIFCVQAPLKSNRLSWLVEWLWMKLVSTLLFLWKFTENHTLYVAVPLLSHVWILWPHELQHPRLPCPSLSPRVCSDSCLLNQWCHPTISSSVATFSPCSQSFPASGSFPMSQLLALGSQSIGVSASASIIPMDSQGWFVLRLT